MKLKNLNISILYLFGLGYISLSLFTSVDTTDLNSSAEQVLFNGKFIEWMVSSVTSSGRFVPFSNAINIFIFQFTDKFYVFFIAKVILVIVNFYFLYKIFEELKINKYFPLALILCLINHSFNNAIYITSFEAEISFLVTLFFYLQLLNIKKEKILNNFFQILIIIYLLGLKESMFGFFLFFNIASYFFINKRKNILISIIILIYISIYLFQVSSNLDTKNIYGISNLEGDFVISFVKNISQYIISFPLVTLILIICNIIYFNFLFLKQKNLNENEKIFIVFLISIIGYLSVYFSMRLFAFRYVYPIIILILPIFFYSYTRLNKYIKVFLFMVFIIGPLSSTYINLKNQINSKQFNSLLNQQLNIDKDKENIILIHNFPNTKRYLLEDQVHDLNEIDKLKLFFYDKNLNEKNQNNDSNTYISKYEFNETDLIIFFYKSNNLRVFNNNFGLDEKKIKAIKKKCYQPILPKYFIFGKKCNENLEIYFYDNN